MDEECIQETSIQSESRFFFPLFGEIAIEKRCTSLGYFSLGYHICSGATFGKNRRSILLDVQDVRAFVFKN